MPDFSQTTAYRAVLGAIKNTLQAHPEWKVPDALPGSIAKRAAGTLASLTTGSALAASKRSQKRLKSVHKSS